MHKQLKLDFPARMRHKRVPDGRTEDEGKRQKLQRTHRLFADQYNYESIFIEIAKRNPE